MRMQRMRAQAHAQLNKRKLVGTRLDIHLKQPTVCLCLVKDIPKPPL